MESSNKVWAAALVVFWGLGFASCRAQTAAEFLRQKKTQQEYLLTQLGYLELYGWEIRKGYELAREGLGMIKGFTSGELKLHEGFFERLSRVSSVVREDFRVVEIARMQLNIRSAFSALVASSPAEPPLGSYIQEVRKKVIAGCNQDLNELLDIVLSSEVEMDDKARLERLKIVYLSMKGKAEFSAYFCAQVQALVLNNRSYKIDLKQLRRFYEKY